MSIASARIIPLLLSAALLSACAEPPSKQAIGAGVGGIAGTVVGSQFGSGLGRVVATAAGGLIGALLGGSVGKSMDKADKDQVEDAVETAHGAPVGQPVTWSNPDSGKSGTVTATREGRDKSGNVCRDYQHTINVDGHDETINGTACRQPDGTWKVVK